MTRIALISLCNRELAFGLRQLSTVLKNHGHECHLIFFKQMSSSKDPTLSIEMDPNSNFFVEHTPEEMGLLTGLLADLQPQLVGISLSSPFFHLAGEITGKIRESLDVPMIWGGVHPTLQPEECIAQADMICIGEGEEALVELADALERDQPFDSIANLWVRRGETISRNAPRPLLQDLDTLGFPDSVDDEFKHFIDKNSLSGTAHAAREHPGNTIDLMTSRGCPFSCTYCCVKALREASCGKGPYLRRRGPRSVIDEILQRIALNPAADHIHFWDDVFTFDRKWQEEFSRLYAEEVGLPFTCYAHPEFTGAEILALLKEAGLQCVNVGIQTGSERIAREIYDRRTGNDKILQTARLLQEMGISAWYDLICDNPYEKDEDLKATLDLMLSLPRPFGINMHSLCFFPQTSLTGKALADGIIDESQVDGTNQKGITQFRVSLDSPRSRRHTFWNILIGMSRHDFFSTDKIRSLSRNRLLRRFPRLLQSYVIRALRRQLRDRDCAPPARPSLNIRHFELLGRGEGLNLRLALARAESYREKVILALRVYPARNPSHPERYLGAWNVPVEIPEVGLSLRIDWAFPALRFHADDEELSISDLWIGDLRESGLYRIEATLYDPENRPLDTRILPCHSSNLFHLTTEDARHEAISG